MQAFPIRFILKICLQPSYCYLYSLYSDCYPMMVYYFSLHIVVMNADLRPLLPLLFRLFPSSTRLLPYVVTLIHPLGNCQFPTWELSVTLKETTSSLYDV